MDDSTMWDQRECVVAAIACAKALQFKDGGAASVIQAAEQWVRGDATAETVRAVFFSVDHGHLDHVLFALVRMIREDHDVARAWKYFVWSLHSDVCQ